MTQLVEQPVKPGEMSAPAIDAAPNRSSAPDGAPPARRTPRRLPIRWLLLIPILLVVLVGGTTIVINLYRDDQLYVSTDNAQVSGQFVSVGAMNAGRVDTIYVSVGDPVRKGDVLAQVALPTQVGVAQNGQPQMEFLGAADTRVDVKSPIDGQVAAVSSAVGATVPQGQAIVMLVDPTQLWVNANIDETKIWRLQVGQPVEVHLDALNQTLPGTVESLTPATASSFSILPQSNTTGNFTKVTQVVPVRIAVSFGDAPGLLGSSASVKVRAPVSPAG
jgi:multidrug resistance efflux pump